MRNYFSHTNLYIGVWNALNCGKVSVREWLIILRFTIFFGLSGSYFIPRILDTDSNSKKNKKITILRFLIPLLNEKIIDNGAELYPIITSITDTRVYFKFSIRPTNDREKIKNIILAQTVSDVGIKVSKNIKINPSGLVRFSFTDEFGSSEIIFKELSVIVEIKEPNKKDSAKFEFKEDLELLKEYYKLDLVRNAEIEGELILGVHVVDMNNRVTIKGKTKKQILIRRMVFFMRELDAILPYGIRKSRIDWDSMVVSSTNNIIQH